MSFSEFFLLSDFGRTQKLQQEVNSNRTTEAFLLKASPKGRTKFFMCSVAQNITIWFFFCVFQFLEKWREVGYIFPGG